MKDTLAKVAVHCLPLGWAMVLALLSASDTCAQSPQPTPRLTSRADESSANEGDSAQVLSSEVNNPTAPLSLIQFRDVLAPTVPGADGPANLFEIQPVLPISSSHSIPFHQFPEWLVGFELNWILTGRSKPH